MTYQVLGTGDEKSISEMSDEELIAVRDFWNAGLKDEFFKSSNSYNAISEMVREVEEELNRREHEGPPWIVD